MALWNKVFSCFDYEEETINFGRRTTTENNGSLYETSTIATIQSTEEVVRNPNVLASVQYSRVCVIIDKSVTIFKNETCKEILLNVNFESMITCYCISDNGLFLFVVLSSGILYCLNLLNNGQVIFTKDIKDGHKIITIFLQNVGDEYNIYLITKNGAVYRVSQLNNKLVKFIKQNETHTNIKIENLTEEIHCVQLFKGFYDEEVICAAIGMINRDISIAMLCPSKLFMWPTEQYNNFKSSSSYIKVKFFRNHMAMLCLRTDHILKMMCPQTLLGVYMDTICALDFAIIENNDNSSCQILVLAASDDNYIGNTVRVLSFPEFEEKFRITVPVTTYLVEIMDPCDEIILYLEGVNDLRSNTNYIDTIRVKTVSESIPEYQLQRLLRKEQFDAAEALAKKFNLSTEPIYCKKATLVLSQLEPWAKKNSVRIQLDMLFSILDKIKNVQYIVECCSKALIPDYEQMRKIHVYARSRIIESTTKTKSNENLNLLYLINNMLHKLETFHMIWEFKKRSQCYYDYDIMKEWIRFQQANFVEEYKTYINLGEMEIAALIWTRHLPEIIKYVSVKTVKDIFAIIPENTSPAVIWPWLSHFIPTLLLCLPSVMSEIICWGCKKVKLFEKTHYSEWPQIGIDFVNRFIKLLKFEENHQSLYFHQEYLSNDSSLKQLILLTQAMSDIQKLKMNYRLKIPLNFYNGDPMEVSHMLLDRVHVDIIPEFVNTFLKQYMLNNSLKNDYVFTLYIQKTMRNSRSWSGEESTWEDKIIVIIDLIQNIETKLQQVLEVLKNISVPWSPTIENLAETSSTVDHILASQIRTECNYVPIKLILKKYGYERIGINDRLVHRIIKENHDEMISHIQCITKNDPLLRKKAFSFCINYYLSKGNFTKVMEILNSLERDVLLYCCAQIVNYVISSFRLKTVPESLPYYIEMLGWVKLQLGKLSKECEINSNYCNHIISNIDEVKSIYFLKKDFEISITIHEYQTDKKQILQRYIEELCKVEMKKNNDLIICKKVIKVAELLKLQKTNAISLLLNWTKNANLFNYFFRYEKESFHLLTDECQYIYKICSTILQHAKVDVDVAIAIRNLSSSALCVCLDDDLKSMLLLYNWINLYQQCLSEKMTYFTNSADRKQNEILKSNWELYTVYKDLAITTDESLLPLFRNIISIQKFYITKFIRDTELNNEDPLEKLLDNIKKLEVKHKDYCLLQMIKTLYFSFYVASNIDVTLLSEITSVYFNLLMKLLKKVISTRSFDLQLGLSCLFMLSKSEAYRWISITYKSFQPDCTQHLRISILGYEYFRLLKTETSIQIFKTNKTMHCWAQKLSKYSISYKEVLTSDATTRRQILQHIMKCNDADINVLLHFCNDFGFDTQDCLLLYLQTVIKTWNPKFIIKDLSGKKELHINENEVNELRKKCNVIAAMIEDKAALKNCVKTIFLQINFYYYEIFIILMDLIKDKSTEHRNYILFLQNYMRTNQPTQIEYDEWMHRNPGYASLPPIAKWRLPFLPKIELWTLISPELNLKTYEKWLDIAPILKLQSHIVCTLAIKGEVRHVWGNKRETDKWNLYPKNSTLLSDIKRCIERMTGPDSLYYATVALYYVVNHTPPGADQVAAVDECYKYAQLSAQKSTVFEEGMLEKIKFKYLRFTSEHILRTHGLGKNKYLELIGNPFKLVHELYSDESIPTRYRCVDHRPDHRPDINSAVDYISQLYSINIIKLRIELLQEWLQPDVKYIKLNQSITETFSVTTNSESNSNCDDNLLRACYILEYGDIELPANFLINICFVDKNEDYSAEVRYRALRVLQMILDTAKLEELTKRDYQTIRNYMKSLIYISRLERLGISYSIKEFETCSKYELVQILWKTQSYTPQALVIISQLCIDFEIYEYSLWDKSLTQLAKLLMINELKKILLQVQNISAIVNSNGYLLGWQVVILEPFRKMDVHPTNEQIDNCIEALQLLYSCPVVHMLCFSDIIKYCFQYQQPHFAVALLPFLHGDDKKNVLEQSKRDFDVAKILQDLNSLSLNGILCVPYCKEVIQNILESTNVQ